MKNIKKVLLKLSRENTGINMLDSGGDNNRGFQKALKLSEEEIFKNPEEKNLKNTFKFLLDNLEITLNSELLNNDFKHFMYKRKDTNYLNDMLEYGDLINENDDYITKKIDCVNTYNFENILSEVLQYIIFYKNKEYYIILQVHRGCDIRGGYTKPQIFKILDIDSFNIDMLEEEDKFFND
tara:strand:+ start:746 stop:1288 length:543 start_codon:yes stop_codon:yes gene_type:complete